MIVAIQAVEGSIMVVGVLTCCSLLHTMCDMKAIHMKGQCRIIQEHMLYEFELGQLITVQ